MICNQRPSLSCTVLLLSAVADATASTLPCDILATTGTPCVAAHSMVRALFAGFNGSLYRVKRVSDNETATIGVASPGGYASASAQDSFCSGVDCIVDMIMDQTENKNHLLVGIGGDVATGPGGRAAPDLGVNASYETSASGPSEKLRVLRVLRDECDCGVGAFN